MFPGVDRHPGLAALAARQCGVVRRRQLRALEVSASFVDNQIAARRWTPIGDSVLVLQNAPPNRRQLMWVAVLDAAGLVALGSFTALELVGFRNFAAEASRLQLIITRGARVTPLPGVQVHESRRLYPDDIELNDWLPCTKPARSAIDAAAWQPYPRFACGLVADVIQRQVATPADFDDALREVGRVRHKAYLRLTVRDALHGAESLGELDLARVCERYGLAPPRRQVQRKDPAGRWRYLDAEWRTPDGELIVLEVDGGHHMDAAHWAADMKRERAVVMSRRRVLRCTTYEIRVEPAEIVAALRALGVPTSAELSEPQRAIAG